jgi:hypothetical protein
MSAMAITLITIAALAVIVFLAVKSGERYEHSDAHVHSTEYAGIIREGHGPLTWFLIAAFIIVFLWTAVYLAGHAGEFSQTRHETSGEDRSSGTI